jgi:hypothetical protein
VNVFGILATALSNFRQELGKPQNDKGESQVSATSVNAVWTVGQCKHTFIESNNIERVGLNAASQSFAKNPSIPAVGPASAVSVSPHDFLRNNPRRALFDGRRL